MRVSARIICGHMKKPLKELEGVLNGRKQKELSLILIRPKVLFFVVEAEFAGSWFDFNSDEIPLALSHTGCVIKVANCPMC